MEPRALCQPVTLPTTLYPRPLLLLLYLPVNPRFSHRIKDAQLSNKELEAATVGKRDAPLGQALAAQS